MRVNFFPRVWFYDNIYLTTKYMQEKIKNELIIYDPVWGSLYVDTSAFLDQVNLGTGNGAGGDEGAVLSTDQIQTALGGIGTVLSSFQFPLEAAHAGYTLL